MAIFMKAELAGVMTDQYDALNGKLQALPGNAFEGVSLSARIHRADSRVITSGVWSG
ncbi:hypothetical protein [Kitasatospora sp. GP82]|uniref:hypothetical protein n=1 Tax=Kitasatospora sp. GP82 TaxID=3035089 RepID=UPI002474289E|nr:hypothetical protein [Kitasatospora sp. GP82]MDH6130437.1 hypothetical protein [Kitasatospora sp. GP82]